MANLGGREAFVSAKFTENDLRADEIREAVFFSVKLGEWPSGKWLTLHNGGWVDPERPATIPRGTDSPPSGERLRSIVDELTILVAMCMSISHPYFYVVETTPRLTPKEARRHEGKGIFPDAKRPRFVVVDYTGLQGLRERQGQSGTAVPHVSPVPHHRRGHWRRLSEQYVAARAEGRTHTWVRPAVVGDLAWADDKRDYRVILDPLRTSAGRT